jgi:hypothetical protein
MAPLDFTESEDAMDNETLKHLLALREVNKALIDGLKAAVYFLDMVEEISEERRKSMIEALNGLIAQSEAAYGEAPTRH